MAVRDLVEEYVSTLLAFALVRGSEVLDGAKSVVLTVVGDEDPDGDEVLDGSEIFGCAPLQYRPKDPTDAGQMEAMMVRYGDERIVIGTKDRRWQVQLDQGEVAVCALGKDGATQAVVRLQPDGSIVLEADTIKLGSSSAGEGVSLGTSLKEWLDNHTHGYIDSVGSAATATPKMTSAPVSSYPTPPGVPDPSPDPSSKVTVE